MAGTPRGRSAQQQAQQAPPPSPQAAPPAAGAPGAPTGRHGVLPETRLIIPPPGGPTANNASPMTRDPRFGRAPGVYGVPVFGVFALQPTETLGPVLNLMWIPHGVILEDFFFITNGMTGTLQDSLATPTVYGSVSGATYSRANMTAPDSSNYGTMYMDTPRAIGPFGCQVVQWQMATTLQLLNPAGAQTWPTTTPLIFWVKWAPVYDGGT